jgi:DNA-directed RNA polymerase V subunit 1
VQGPQDTQRYVLGNADKAGERSSSKQWLEKMKTLFISKGSGFSSRSVITGDPYIGINVIGLPSEIAKQITFEERVTTHNMARLQDIVDKRLCVTYQKGSTSYAISAGARGYTNLRVGQIVNRRIMDGDLVFVNRPPSTHKHSLQAFYVYVHEDHTVKINPLICSPFGADFDGDCIHIFYPQSLPAKAEALELFSVEKQLINSYNGTLSLQVAHDSLLGLKFLIKHSFLSKPMAQQLAMHSSPLRLQTPAILKSSKGPSGPLYTVIQLIQSALPSLFESDGDKNEVVRGEITTLELDRDYVHGAFSEIVASVFSRGSKEALQFMDIVQPMMMELLNFEGFSVGLRDLNMPKGTLQSVKKSISRQAYLLSTKSPNPNQTMDFRVENYLRSCKQVIADVLISSSPLAYLMDTKSDSSITKVVQQLGFLGLQLYRQDRFYSKELVEDCLSTYANRFAPSIEDPSKYPPEAYGLVSSSFYEGLNPFEDLVHAISTREVIVRSSRGLTEPGTLFKNLMAVMRDVVICYDGTVRNMCSNSIIQFAYSVGTEKAQIQLSPPGEPVGVLAATAISKPAYNAVLDSSQSNNTSWELMKVKFLKFILFFLAKLKTTTLYTCILFMRSSVAIELQTD